jgi:hypothetical protein
MHLQSDCTAIITTAIDTALRTATVTGTEEHRRALSSAQIHRTAVEDRYNQALDTLKHSRDVERDKRAAEQSASYALDTCPVSDASEFATRHRVAQDIAAAARRQTAIATAALDKAASALNTAQRAVEAAADALLEAEADILATVVGHLLEETIARGKTLRQNTPDALHTPVNQLREPSSLVVQMLERLEMATRDDLNTPSNILRNGPESTESHAQRRAALIAQQAA